MNAHERLLQAIDRAQDRLRAEVPPDRQAAIIAILRARDQRLPWPGGEPSPDLVSGRRLSDPGGNKALQICLESTAESEETAATPECGEQDLGEWAQRFLAECDRLAEAELVLAHCQTGFMRLVERGEGDFAAWIATKRAPTIWRERADLDWWAGWLARRHALAPGEPRAERPASAGDGPEPATFYRRLAGVWLERLSYQLAYPPDAEIGGCTVRTYRDVLGLLIAWALQARDRGEEVTPRSERDLVAAIAAVLGLDSATAGRALSAFTLDRSSAAYHGSVPDVGGAPVVRVGPDLVAWSVYGLTTQPFFFLTRELRRRDAQAYHNVSHLREDVFRQDLYALFADKRFVTGAGRVRVRREAGDLRTDVDAVVFDRKTGTLGLFELKAQDPFARSTAELARQRDNVLHANRQISGVLAWLQRHGANDFLSRVDARTAKTFRVQKVYPFVLGRYLVHFNDGPEPDRRAAWGTWPQVLRLLDGQPFRGNEGNPIASLFARLSKDAPLVGTPSEAPPREIALGDTRLVVYPSYAAFQSSEARVGARVG